MEDTYSKNYKHNEIIDLCGKKYKIIHLTSYSINNKYLICLAQIKYCMNYLINDIFKKIIDHVMTFVLSYCFDVFIFFQVSYTVAILCYGVYLIILDIIDIVNISTTFEYVIIFEIIFKILYCIVKNIIISIIYYTCITIFAFISFYILGMITVLIRIFIKKIILKNIIKIFGMIKQYINNFNQKIPKMEEVDPLEQVV